MILCPRHPEVEGKKYRSGVCVGCGRDYARKYMREKLKNPEFRLQHNERVLRRLHSDPAHREASRERTRLWVKANRDRHLGYDNPKNRIARLLRAARFRAKKFNIEFSITTKDLLPPPTVCPVLGVLLNYGKPIKTISDRPSLDRRNPELGYIAGNVFVISHRANTLKSDATLQQIESLLSYMKGE